MQLLGELSYRGLIAVVSAVVGWLFGAGGVERLRRAGLGPLVGGSLGAAGLSYLLYRTGMLGTDALAELTLATGLWLVYAGSVARLLQSGE